MKKCFKDVMPDSLPVAIDKVVKYFGDAEIA